MDAEWAQYAYFASRSSAVGVTIVGKICIYPEHPTSTLVIGGDLIDLPKRNSPEVKTGLNSSSCSHSHWVACIAWSDTCDDPCV